jgi:[ribosomal protein S5]-alanine N-acetyltransferase
MQALHSKLILEGQETSRLRFRNVQQDDFNTWLQFCEDAASLKYFWFADGIEDPKEKCRIWFERVFARYQNELGCLNVLIDKASGELVGQCGLLIQTVDDVKELEIGYSIMPQHRQKGYAFEAAKYCRDYAFSNNLTDSLISIIHPENANSANVAGKNGMKIDKQSMFNSSYLVNIFRIRKEEWKQLQ